MKIKILPQDDVVRSSAYKTTKHVSNGWWAKMDYCGEEYETSKEYRIFEIGIDIAQGDIRFWWGPKQDYSFFMFPFENDETYIIQRPIANGQRLDIILNTYGEMQYKIVDVTLKPAWIPFSGPLSFSSGTNQ